MMLGYMTLNEKQAGQRPDVGEFIARSLGKARERLGAAPGMALVNVSADDYQEAIEAQGLPVERAPWILPNAVYFVEAECE